MYLHQVIQEVLQHEHEILLRPLTSSCRQSARAGQLQIKEHPVHSRAEKLREEELLVTLHNPGALLKVI